MKSFNNTGNVSPEILRSVTKIAKNLQLVFNEEQLTAIIAALESGANVEALIRLISSTGSSSA